MKARLMTHNSQRSVGPLPFVSYCISVVAILNFIPVPLAVSTLSLISLSRIYVSNPKFQLFGPGACATTLGTNLLTLLLWRLVR